MNEPFPTAIVYTSNSGFTAQYAQLLSEKTDLACHNLKRGSLPEAGACVIYLGWLMAGRVQGLSKARKRWNVCAIGAVGMGTPDMDQTAGIRRAYALTEDFPLFYLQGGFDLTKLHGLYHFMMNAMARGQVKQLGEKADRTPDEQQMLQWFTTGGSAVSEDNLASLCAWLEAARG